MCFESKAKGRAFPIPTRLDPDIASVHFNDPSNECEPNTGAFDALVQTIEESKDAFMELQRDPDAIITDKKDRRLVITENTDFDRRFRLCSHELDSVIDEVLNDLHQPHPVAEYIR